MSGTPGKIILFGEYAVLHGGLALVAAVDRYATVEVAPAEQTRVTGVGLGTTTLDDSASAPLPFARRLLRTDPAPVAHYTVDTRAFGDADAPGGWTKLGLGSSAASTVALARAAWPEADTETLYHRCQRAHRAVQGTGSGADIAASAYGGLLAYRWHEAAERGEVHPVPVPPFEIWTAWMDRAASTPTLVRAVARWAAQHAAEHAALMAQISGAAEAAADALCAHDRAGVTRAVQATDAALRALTDAAAVPIVTGAHTRLAEAVAPCGAVSKPTGAGGGDLALLWATDPEALPAAARAAEAAGFRVHRFTIASHA